MFLKFEFKLLENSLKIPLYYLLKSLSNPKLILLFFFILELKFYAKKWPATTKRDVSTLKISQILVTWDDIKDF